MVLSDYHHPLSQRGAFLGAVLVQAAMERMANCITEGISLSSEMPSMVTAEEKTLGLMLTACMTNPIVLGCGMISDLGANARQTRQQISESRAGTAYDNTKEVIETKGYLRDFHIASS